MYLFTQRTEQVPDEDSSEKNTTPVKEVLEDTDDDEVLIEDVVDEAPEPPKTKDVIIEEWVKLNPQAPIWMRYVALFSFRMLYSTSFSDAKDVTDEEHELFYQATFKDYANKPAAWQHFSGDSSGASFRGIIYIPSKMCVPLKSIYCRRFLRSLPPLAITTTGKPLRVMCPRTFVC